MVLFLYFWILTLILISGWLANGIDTTLIELPAEAARVGKKLGVLYLIMLVLYAVFRFLGFNQNHWDHFVKMYKEKQERK